MSRAAGSSDELPKALGEYMRVSESPLCGLLFLLPMLAVYEIGTSWYLRDANVEYRNVAFQLTRKFFQLFGVSGRFLPPLAVVGILLAWHIARKDKWKMDLGALACMAVESLLWGALLVGVTVLASRQLLPNAAPALESRSLAWQGKVVLSLGAGIYEELVFRLAAFTLLNMLLVDYLKIPKAWGFPLLVIISSVLFAAYHNLWGERFYWPYFVQRAIYGVYFGTLFLWRGFGISAGAHAAYDMIVM